MEGSSHAAEYGEELLEQSRLAARALFDLLPREGYAEAWLRSKATVSEAARAPPAAGAGGSGSGGGDESRLREFQEQVLQFMLRVRSLSFWLFICFSSAILALVSFSPISLRLLLLGNFVCRGAAGERQLARVDARA